MRSGRSGYSVVLLFAAMIALTGWLALTGYQIRSGFAAGLTEPDDHYPRDLRYFHHAASGGRPFLNPADASVQVKGIAAQRHCSPLDVRRLLDQHIEEREKPLGMQRVNIDALNRALDERCPMQ